MAEFKNFDRLQPSLLDRLTDDDPFSKVESRDKQNLSSHDIRAAVMRDLASLVNTTCFAAIEDLGAYPEVASSVVNYGIPDLTGVTSHAIDTTVLARIVKQAIVNFEPRFLAHCLKVRVETDPEDMGRNSLVFHIEGQIWAMPNPLALHLKTEVNLDTKHVRVVEAAR